MDALLTAHHPDGLRITRRSDESMCDDLAGAGNGSEAVMFSKQGNCATLVMCPPKKRPLQQRPRGLHRAAAHDLG